jgi:dihydroflavonol-4-reductase
LLQNNSNLEIVEADILDFHKVSQEAVDCDLVIHCAAVVSYAPHRFNEMFQTNVEGTRNIVDVCIELKKKLIHLSSIAAIGNYAKNEVDETEKWNESDTVTYYSKTKYFSELEVWRGIEEGLTALILCPSVVLGQGDMEQSSTKLFSYVKNGGKYYTEGNINYVDVRDITTIVLESLNNEQVWNQRYILNAGTTTYKVFFEKIAKLIKVVPPKKKVTPFLASLAWRLESIKYIFTKKEPLITKETAQMSSSKRVYANTLASNKFNIKFKDLDATLAWCCEKNK